MTELWEGAGAVKYKIEISEPYEYIINVSGKND